MRIATRIDSPSSPVTDLTFEDTRSRVSPTRNDTELLSRRTVICPSCAWDSYVIHAWPTLLTAL